MKKLILIAVSLLTISAASFAGDGSEKKNRKNTSVIIAEAPIKGIVLNNGIDLVLTEGNENHIQIRGKEKDVKNITYTVKEGVLYISSKNALFKNKAVVYVSVSQLRSIEVNGASKISSSGFLRSSKLKVLVNDEANFDLKNYGEILFETDEKIDLHFEKYAVRQ